MSPDTSCIHVQRPLREALKEIETWTIREMGRTGSRDLPDGTGDDLFMDPPERIQAILNGHFLRGEGTWRHLFEEGVFNVLAATNPRSLRTDLVWTAALCLEWIIAIDRRPVTGGLK